MRATAAVWWAMSADRHLERVVVAEHHHGDRVAHEDQVDAGLVGDAGGRRVVGGHHHERHAPLRGPHRGDRALLSHLGLLPVQRLVAAGGWDECIPAGFSRRGRSAAACSAARATVVDVVEVVVVDVVVVEVVVVVGKVAGTCPSIPLVPSSEPGGSNLAYGAPLNAPTMNRRKMSAGSVPPVICLNP